MKPGEFATSDHHWSHARILTYTKRPWATVEEMDEALIRAWNAKVPPGAAVYYLGDLYLGKPDKIMNILRRLNGEIRLILGNHDKWAHGDALSRFSWVKDYYESKTEDGRKIVMCHYPFMTWNGAHRGAWNLHGHSHGTLQDRKLPQMDVGIDTTTDWAPYSYEEICTKMKGRTYKSVDHHQNRVE